MVLELNHNEAPDTNFDQPIYCCDCRSLCAAYPISEIKPVEKTT